ncbi:hypothetical protein HDV62DRAFT_286975 [Trichoderma sp. SZMC 28011]
MRCRCDAMRCAAMRPPSPLLLVSLVAWPRILLRQTAFRQPCSMQTQVQANAVEKDEGTVCQLMSPIAVFVQHPMSCGGSLSSETQQPCRTR